MTLFRLIPCSCGIGIRELCDQHTTCRVAGSGVRKVCAVAPYRADAEAASRAHSWYSASRPAITSLVTTVVIGVVGFHAPSARRPLLLDWVDTIAARRG